MDGSSVNEIADRTKFKLSKIAHSQVAGSEFMPRTSLFGYWQDSSILGPVNSQKVDETPHSEEDILNQLVQPSSCCSTD